MTSNAAVAVCVVTSRPPPPSSTSSATSSASAPGLVLCPRTGATLGSLRTGGGMGSGGGGAAAVGIRALAAYPVSGRNRAFIAYGGTGGSGNSNGKGDGDCYAMLLEAGANSPRWKCRLPEPMGAGGSGTGGRCLAVSPCGRYVASGAASGRGYIWDVLDDGELMRVFRAHHRPVTCVVFSDDGSFLVTGGADGIVNSFSVLDLVCPADGGGGGGSEAAVCPSSTWSEHSLPVTDLHLLPSNRVVSSSTDQNVVVMELFSGATLARILLPSAINCVTADLAGSRLFAGAYDGAVYCVDLDARAIALTAESATVVASEKSSSSQRGRTGPILGGETSGGVSELRGHDAAVSCLGLVEGGGGGPGGGGDGGDLLVSGDEGGCVRVWDVPGGVCRRVIRPWSAGPAGAAANSTGTRGGGGMCRCSAVLVLRGGGGHGSPSSPLGGASDLTRGRGRGGAGGDGVASFVHPPRRFPSSERGGGGIGVGGDGSGRAEGGETCIPNVRPLRDADSIDFWEGGGTGTMEHVAKRCRLDASLGGGDGGKLGSPTASTEDGGGGVGWQPRPDALPDSEAEIATLRRRLEEAQKTIERWKAVNNKLAIKLKKQG